jgi:hypothetical protein
MSDDDLIRLRDERAAEARVKELKQLVVFAYHEGWLKAGGDYKANSGWQDSETRATLTKGQADE